MKFGMCFLIVVDLPGVGKGVCVLTSDSKNIGSVVRYGLEAVGLVGLLLGDIGEDLGYLAVLEVGVLGGVVEDGYDALSGLVQAVVLEGGGGDGHRGDGDDLVVFHDVISFLNLV